MQEIGREELITAEMEVILARKIKDGSQEALEKLTKANLRFVVSVAKQFQGQGLPLSDLINEGNLGLIKAAQRFDETRGFKFISYAVWWIRQSVLQALEEQRNIIRLPLNQIGALRKISKTFSKLEQEFERDPSSEELAEVLEFDSKTVIDVRSRSQRTVSLSDSIKEEGESTMLDVIEDLHAEKPDQALMNDSFRKEAEDKLSVLNDLEREILFLFFGINQNHPLTLEEIGEKFGLTREEVRRKKVKAIQRLRNPAKFLQNGAPKTNKHPRGNSGRKVVEVLPTKHASNGSLNTKNTKKEYYVGIAGLIRGDVVRVKKAIRQLLASDYSFLANQLDIALKAKKFNKKAGKLFLENRPDVAVKVALLLGDIDSAKEYENLYVQKKWFESARRINMEAVEIRINKKVVKISQKPQKVVKAF